MTYMKRFIIPVFILTIWGDLPAQLPSFSKNNQAVLYQGMDNIITIDLNGSNGELVNCKASKSQRVSRYADSLYAVYPLAAEEDCLVKLYYKNIIVEQIQMKIVPPLELRVMLKNEQEGVIRIKDLPDLNTFLLKPTNGTLLPNLNFKLISGNISVINANGQLIYSGIVRENIFSEQLFKITKDLTQGCKIILSNPRVINHQNQHVQTQPYSEWRIVDN